MEKMILLCVDTIADNGLIDRHYLNEQGIEVYFLSTQPSNKHDTRNEIIVEQITSAILLQIAKRVKAQKIISFSEYLFATVAEGSSLLNLSAMTNEQAYLFSDKYQMIQKIQPCEYVIPTLLVNKKMSYADLTQQLGATKLCLKPRAEAGSLYVTFVTQQSELEDFYHKDYYQDQKFIVQPAIEGELYHVEMVVQNGIFLLNNPRKYSSPNCEMVTNNQAIFSTSLADHTLQTKLAKAATTVRDRLQLNNGIMHTEFFVEHQSKKIYFLETNLRPPGIGLNYLYQHLLGISLETLLCLIACNKPVPKLSISTKASIAGYYPMVTGQIKKLNVIQLPYPCDHRFFIEAGQILSEKNYMNKMSMINCWDLPSEQVSKILSDLQTFKVAEVS